MKFTVERKALASTLSLALKACETRTTIPILSHFLVTANGDVSLTATDLETACTCRVKGEIQTQGKAAIPARPFAEYINALDSDTVDVSVSEKGVATLASGKNRARINCNVSENFPEIQRFNEPCVTISASDLAGMLRRAIFVPEVKVSAGSYDYRNCVFFDFFGGAFDCYAVASHRATLSTLQCQSDRDRKAIPMSIKSASELLAACASAQDSECKIAWDENSVTAQIGDSIELFMRLLTARPPAGVREKVVSKLKDHALVSAKDLKGAIERAVIFSDKKVPKTVLSIKQEGSIEIGSSTHEGSGDQIVEAVATKDLTFGINPTYLLDLLGVFENQVRLEFTGADSPMRFCQPDGPYDFSAVIMPMYLPK